MTAPFDEAIVDWALEACESRTRDLLDPVFGSGVVVRRVRAAATWLATVTRVRESRPLSSALCDDPTNSGSDACARRAASALR